MFANKITDYTKNPFITKVIQIYLSITAFLEMKALPVLILFIRFWMAKIFWYSGLTKISSWQATLFLFKDVYKVPFIPPEMAAYSSTFFELSCPVLLLLGFATRLATLPMLAMTAVIEFTYLNLIDHTYWAILLALILFYGPGTLSLDHYLCKKYIQRNGYNH